MRGITLFGAALLFSMHGQAAQYEHSASWQQDSWYSDNWTFSDQGEIGAAMLRSTLRTRSQRETELHRLRLDLDGSFQAFQSDQLEDLKSYGGQLEWMRRREYGGLVVQASHRNQASLLSTFDSDGIVRANENERLTLFTLTDYRELSETRLLSLTLSHERADFDDDLAAVPRADYRLSRAILAQRVAHSENFSTTLSFAYDEIERDRRFLSFFGPFTLVNEQVTTTRLYGPVVAADWQLSPSWAMNLSASARRRSDTTDFSSPLGSSSNDSRDDDYFGSMGLQYRAALVRAELNLSRSFRPSQSSAIQLTVRDQLQLSYDRMLSERWRLALNASVFQDRRDAQAGVPDDDRTAYEGTVRLSYDAAGRWQSSLSYRYQSQDIDLFGLLLERHFVGFSLTYRFGLPGLR